MTHFSGAYIIIIIMINIYEIILQTLGETGENLGQFLKLNIFCPFSNKICNRKMFVIIWQNRSFSHISPDSPIYKDSKTYVMCRCTPNAVSQKAHKCNFTNAKTRKDKTRQGKSKTGTQTQSIESNEISCFG